jgi:hypothetical protein
MFRFCLNHPQGASGTLKNPRYNVLYWDIIHICNKLPEDTTEKKIARLLSKFEDAAVTSKRRKKSIPVTRVNRQFSEMLCHIGRKIYRHF